MRATSKQRVYAPGARAGRGTDKAEAIVMQWGKSQRSMLGLLVVLVALGFGGFAHRRHGQGRSSSNNCIVEGATVILETKDSGARRFKVTTNRKGEYIQIGLQPGSWTITASKDGVGEAKTDIRITPRCERAD